MNTDYSGSSEQWNQPVNDDKTMGKSSSEKDVATYDFKHPKLVSKEIMRVLRNMHELLSRNLSRIFTNTIGSKVEVDLKSIEQVVFSAFINELDAPSAFYLFNIEEFGDWAILELDPTFCMKLVDMQSGGKGKAEYNRRVLTRIEEKIMSRSMRKIFKELTAVWKPQMSFTVEHFVYESKTENIHSISSVEPAIIANYEILMDDQPTHFNICYPYVLLKEPMNNSIHRFEKDTQKSEWTPKQRQAHENCLKQVETTISVYLGTTRIKVRDLIGLKEGDAIKLDQEMKNPLDIRVNNRSKMKGFPGTVNKKRAVKIFEVSRELIKEDL